MDKSIFNEIRNSLYEAEGLLELLSVRDDKEAELVPMIEAKLSLVMKLLPELTDKAVPEPTRPEVAESIEPEPDAPDISDDVAPRAVPVLCLNDRFKFRRALFGGSEEELNGVLSRIAGMQSYEEAEEYIYGVLGFEPEDEAVADFLEIIKTYLES